MKMSINKKTKAFLAYVVCLCMTLTLMAPIFAYAENSVCTFTADGEAYAATVKPYTNDMGLMVNALDLTNLFGFEAEFNSADKSLEINSEKHGKVVLMHKATEFYSKDSVYPCAPAFYAENGVPMISVEFFCAIYDASYTYDENTGVISIQKDTIAKDAAKVVAGDVTVPLHIIPFTTQYGLVTSAKDLAKAIGADADFNAENGDLVLTYKNKGAIHLTSGGTSFTTDNGTFECLPMYFAENGVPMIAVDFFCALYGISYTYDAETKTININTELTQDELDEANKPEEGAVKLASNEYFRGSIYFNSVPKDGLNIKMVIQHVRYYAQSHNNSYYTITNTHISDEYEVTEDNPQMHFSASPEEYSSDSYYIVSFEDADNGYYAYIDYNGYLVLNDESLIAKDRYISYCLRHYNYSNYSYDFDAPVANILHGKITLPDYVEIENDVYVDIMLQTRGATYYNEYGDADYYSNNIYYLDTKTITPESREATYTYILDNCYENNYPYISIFYVCYDDSNTLMPYGYYSTDNTVKTLSSEPYYHTVVEDAKAFRTKGSYNVDLELATDPDYQPPVYATLTAVSKNASAGQQISIPVKMENNPGIAYVRFELDWDSSVLTLDSIDGGSIFAEEEIVEGVTKGTTAGSRVYYTFLAYTGNSNKTNNGTLATFNFKVKNNINVERTEVYICGAEAYDIYENPVQFRVYDSIINFATLSAGDVTGDGTVNGADLLRLAKYFAGWDVDITDDAADTNGDGKVNHADLLRLAKYILDPDNVELGF